VIAGAFCYDVTLDKRLDEWMPTKVSVLSGASFSARTVLLMVMVLPIDGT
jgi:hypothetical protein